MYSRTVDLVGDYSGDELFILEGDSLLLHIFSSDKLDFNPGFQLLHATYMVESFLRALRRRKCHFQIIFFEENSSLCVPPHSTSELRSRYLFAREAIVQHLCRNLSVRCSDIGVRVFRDYRDQEFVDYLASSGTYFFMCHDGALSSRVLGVVDGGGSESDVSTESEGPKASGDDADGAEDAGDGVKMPTSELLARSGFRSMIHWFICRGYNVALLNTLECRDTKVCLP